MKFTKNANANMTSLKGEVLITYAELTEIFGRPDHGPNSADLDKVTCEWALKFEDGTIATIYDWKTWRTPLGEYEWHIGGHDMAAVDRVTDTIAMHRDRLVTMIREYQGA
jgi:hypothetical protein